MDPDIADPIRDWPSRSIDEAHQGLRTLADADFSGALDVSDTWVFLLNGQIVGLHGGTVDDIEGAAGTAYQAPGEALPLLFAMRSGDDAEPRAQYYTEETPLEDVDATLSAGGFTGYLELSENVLSGDYYVVYHGGQSRAVAVVGTREEVILGKEAFDLAADEVGIYEVIEAPISITAIPRDPDASDVVAASTGGTAEGQDGPSTESNEDTDEPTDMDGISGETDTGSTASSGEGEPIQSASGQHAPTDTDGSDPELSNSPAEESATSASSETDTPPSGVGDHDSEPGQDTESESPSDDTETTDADGPGGSETAERSVRLQQLETALNDRTEESDRLRERVEELESALDPSDEQAEAVERRDRPWEETVGETSLFVRYASRSDSTLEDLRDGVEKDSLASNLVLDYHTNFDDTTVSIDGVRFEDALHASAEWSFLTWLVRDLPFEIRDTGRAGELTPLYQALPLIDRVELAGSLETNVEGRDGTVEYDFICRDKTGNPLIVADIHEGRDPVSGSAIENLIDRTSAVAADHESLAAAYAVSPSFFRPEALKTAQSATSSGFLSRDGRLSYVKVDRKTGYHLWLVEARNDDYHVTIPEL